MDNSSNLKIDSHNKKWIFIFLSILSLLVLILLVSFSWYLISPRIYSLNRYLWIGVQLIFILSLLMITGGLFLIVLSAITEKDFLFPYGKKQITLKILFPINLFLGKIFGWPKDKVKESFIEVNNSLFKATQRKIKKGRILLLLSHCMQNFDCPNKVTAHYENCQRCGKCLIDDIIGLKERYNLSLSIATGGTLARKVVVEYHPTAIVAVACERDLTSGIQDVYPIPVYGILNQRPFGPCVNTRVDLDRLEQIIRFIQNGKL